MVEVEAVGIGEEGDVKGAGVGVEERVYGDDAKERVSPSTAQVESEDEVVHVEETKWNAYVDDASGDVYYFNHLTLSTEWDLPPGAVVVEEEPEEEPEVSVCVCERETEGYRERESVCVCARMCLCVCILHV